MLALAASSAASGGRQASEPLVPPDWQPRPLPYFSQQQNAEWWDFQKKLAREAAAYKPQPADAPSGLVLLGDSITERLSGTARGLRKPEAIADGLGPDFLRTTFGERWPAYQVHGISADVAEPDLLWRIREGGELSPQMATDPRLLMTLLIGTNDIGRLNKTAEETHESVVAVARALLAGSRGKLLINALLPRVPSGFDAWAILDWPARLRKTNALLADTSAQLADEYGDGRVAFANCTDRPFRLRNLDRVNSSTMPDKVHPNQEGWRRLFDECIRPELERLDTGSIDHAVRNFDAVRPHGGASRSSYA